MDGDYFYYEKTMTSIMQRILGDKSFRVRYFEHDFYLFYAYYSKNKVTWFQRAWCEALGGRENILFLAFRGSAKTTIVRWYVLWCIVYSKEPYIVVQSFEDTLSKSWVREIAKMMVLPSVLEDYGMQFPLSMKREDMTKSSMSSFETKTGVKVEAKSLGGTIRGANTVTKAGKNSRPTLVVLDDIDVQKSVRTASIIDENERKILGETFEAMDQARRRVLFLGNVINTDGIVPRFKKKFTGIWKIMELWVYGKDGKSVWPERFTPGVIQDLKNNGERSFAQNYLGIPFTMGETIISRQKIKYEKSVPDGAKAVIGIDPAFSEKTGTDEMGFALTYHSGKFKYLHTMIGFRGEDKNEERFCVYVENMYRKYGVAMINIEGNNGGEIIGRMLKGRGLAVKVLTSTKDKVTRLREYEGCFDRGEVFFLPGTDDGVEQLINFPNGEADDRVDAMVNSFGYSSGVILGRA